MALSKTFQDGKPLSAADVNTYLTMPVPNAGDPIIDPTLANVTPDAIGEGITVHRLRARRFGPLMLLECYWTGTANVSLDGNMSEKLLLTLPPSHRPFSSNSAVITATGGARMVSYGISASGNLTARSSVPNATQTGTSSFAFSNTFVCLFFVL